MIISDIEQALSHKQEAIDRLANGETLVDGTDIRRRSNDDREAATVGPRPDPHPVYAY